jgi:hypothetical protein
MLCDKKTWGKKQAPQQGKDKHVMSWLGQDRMPMSCRTCCAAPSPRLGALAKGICDKMSEDRISRLERAFYRKKS